MLLRFTVENLFCFAEETVFSMVATADEQHPEHKHELREGYPHKALRIAALYGANAHGKSKLVEAMAFARKLILDRRGPKQRIAVNPYRLDAAKRGQPSRCEFVFFHENVEYTYGFLVDQERVIEEWLFARVDEEEQSYFERGIDGQDNEPFIQLGDALKLKEGGNAQRLEFVAQGTRDNQLFLAKAVDDNVDSLQPVYDWFDDVLTIVPTNYPIQLIALKAHKDVDFATFMGDFLRLAGTGIDGIVTKEDKIDNPFLDAIRQQAEDRLVKKGWKIAAKQDNPLQMSLFAEEDGDSKAYRLNTQHYDSQGEPIPFSLEDESSGTLRLIELSPILFALNMDSSNSVFIIDELDLRLHPLLSRFYVEAFLKKSQGQTCQLIFTTHETSLLNLELLRRDEIWFVEKDRKGASQVYSLADFNFKPNPDIKLERGYLHGRFGAIPFIGDMRSLGWM